MQRPDLAEELLTMAADDARVRSELAVTGELFDGYNDRMRATHRRNGDRLGQIIDDVGWPDDRLVGHPAAAAAFTIVQHDIANPALARRCLPLLRAAHAHGDIDGVQVAYLEDRICAFEGRPQHYGTQMDWTDDGEFGAWPPVDEPDDLDRRRAAIGLPPIDEQLQRARERANTGDVEPSPHDRRVRREAAERFARSVGWRD
jgi:hypothetical protein